MAKTLKTSRKAKNVVGKLINFRGLVYAPVNEQGVVLLFGKVAYDLGMYVELIRPGYPDCVAKRYIGRERWENVNIEFEFKSSHFHHDASKCDMIVCWEHDWKQCPSHIEVVELKEVIKGLENPPMESPDKSQQKGEYSIDALLRRVTPAAKRLYDDLVERLIKFDDKVYTKPAKYAVMLYSPKRVFANVKILKQQLRIHLFTNGIKMKGVEGFSGEYGYKWGKMYVKDRTELQLALKNMRRSQIMVNECVSKNIPTGWYAEAED